MELNVLNTLKDNFTKFQTSQVLKRDQIQKFKMIEKIVKFDHETVPFRLKEMQIEDKL